MYRIYRGIQYIFFKFLHCLVGITYRKDLCDLIKQIHHLESFLQKSFKAVKKYQQPGVYVL
jgi:hypothetical protein